MVAKKHALDSNELSEIGMQGTMMVDGRTKVMGVIGDPIAQAKTPEVINPIFQHMNANIVCVPFHISSDQLEITWRGLRAIGNVIGFGVTLPHKQAVVSFCDSLDPVAEKVGAVNVVRRERDGSFRGYQFDGRGFCSGLLDQGHVLSKRSCLMIGAGGAAMAIACSLIENGIESLTIANRTFSKAQDLAAMANSVTGTSIAKAGQIEPQGGQLLINATSLGLNPDDAFPVPVHLIDNTMLVAEVVAQPEITPFLEAARNRGAAIHSGMHMIRAQVKLIAEHMAAIHA